MLVQLPPFPIPATLVGLLVLALALVILWVVVSIPVYAAGKVVTDGKSDFGQAMGATLGGGVGTSWCCTEAPSS